MENVIYLLVGFLGVFIHSCLRANSLIKDATNANIKFTYKDYLSKDFLGIAISIAMVFLWLLVFPEVATVRPNVLIFTRLSFAAIGFLGSYIVQIIFSRAKAYIRNIVDQKTNVADGVNRVNALDVAEPEIVGGRPGDER